ncbi:SDR family oxidoreductase [Streptomyces sp. NPDC088847]|uniref:SDR family oxidoreductase n=1 Tax=Streptomyces sp. NPDC088847 TaxID=3365909 RepID=UPI0037FA50AC
MDRDELAGTAAPKELAAADREIQVEPFVLDITDPAGLSRLTSRVAELGSLRAVSHAAGISPAMADRRRDFEADPVVAALLDEPLRGDFLGRLREVLGPAVENTGLAYVWAKHGVHRSCGGRRCGSGRTERGCVPVAGRHRRPSGAAGGLAQTVMTALLEQTPHGRVGRAEDVAAAVAFLLSDEAVFVSGIDVPVDGGVCAAVRERAGR